MLDERELFVQSLRRHAEGLAAHARGDAVQLTVHRLAHMMICAAWRWQAQRMRPGDLQLISDGIPGRAIH